MQNNPETNSKTQIHFGVLATLLAGLAMLGPFSVDTYLPAFPQIQASLHASELEVQQTLAVYMMAFAVMTLWHGAFSDSFGRRNIILCSLFIYGIATLGCAAAHNVQYLWAFRILQGLSAGAGTVVGRAIIRDLYQGAPAARLLSMVTMIFSIGPAIAPIIGGFIVKWLDWRSIFLFIFGYTCFLLWLSWRYLPESLAPEQRQPFNARSLWQSYTHILSNTRFYLLAGVVSLNFSGMFIYISSAPVFITRHLGLGPDEFSWLFIPMVSGIFLGALFANRLAGKMPKGRQVNIGYTISLGAAALNVVYHLYFPPSLPWSVLPTFFFTFGISIVAPSATLLLLELFPQLLGTVSSCQSFAVSMLGGITAGVLSPLLSGQTLWLAAGQFGFGILGFVCWQISQRDKHFGHKSG
jgi:MFS transporter, DHA1 family, multidrug resistance protein